MQEISRSIGRTAGSLASLLLAGVASLALSGLAHATLTINSTFDASIPVRGPASDQRCDLGRHKQHHRQYLLH